MKIALLGDIGLFGKFTVTGGLDIDNYFSDFKEVTSDCDYIIGNLELPFSIEKREFAPKSASISSDPENICILKKLGITHVNLANNHIGDFGTEGYELTKQILEDSGIVYFGIEKKQAKIIDGENKLALLGYVNMDSNPVYLRGIDKLVHNGVNVTDCNEIIDIMTNNHSNGFLNIFSSHSGLEHVHLPGMLDIYFARHLSSLFPYVYYGHHPHVVQSIEVVNSSHIFYSLGNFCFDDVYSPVSIKPLYKMTTANRVGLLPILTIVNNQVTEVVNYWYQILDDKLTFLDDESPIVMKIKRESLLEHDLLATEQKRNNIIHRHNRTRKNTRDILWYVRRLNWKYFKLFIKSHKNRKIYSKKFSSQIISIIKGTNE